MRDGTRSSGEFTTATPAIDTTTAGTTTTVNMTVSPVPTVPLRAEESSEVQDDVTPAIGQSPQQAVVTHLGTQAQSMPVIEPKHAVHSSPAHSSPQVHILHQSLIMGEECKFCNYGMVETETDLACVACLVLLSIVTFPFGLVYLCCLNGAKERRCVRCRRRN